MEKYGVDVDAEKTKAAEEGETVRKCPSCDGPIKENVPEFYCINCGTAPFEGERKSGKKEDSKKEE